MANEKKQRILIKLSGEALRGRSEDLYDSEFVNSVADALVECVAKGCEVAVVVGAGNIWRGRAGDKMNRTEADRMGMLATVINAIYLKDAIVRAGGSAHVMTAVPMSPFAENYRAEDAVKYLEEGSIVIFGGGLGIPFLSTDTAGAVRAAEIDADAMLMAKNIDYIYTADPRYDPNAEKLEEIKASEMLAMNLKAIDATATAFCLSKGMPIRIFALNDAKALVRAVMGECRGTLVIPE